MKISEQENRRGSASLEGAISFSVVLVFITAVVSIIAFIRADILMQRSCEQTSEKLATLFPAITTAGDIVSTVSNAIPDGELRSSVAVKAAEAVAAISKIGIAADDLSGGSIRELVLEGVLAKRTASDIAAGYKERNNGSELFMPSYINVIFDIDDNHNVVFMTAEYKISTILGDIGRSCVTSIPVYGDFSLYLNGTAVPDAGEDDIWSEDNFVRGQYFTDKYGANLPYMFPVVDRYEDGEVTTILSMDLTAPDYVSGKGLAKSIKYDINRLAKFNGDKLNYKGTDYVVNDIRSKRLLVIVPSNSDPDVRAQLASYKSYAASKGVILDIRDYGCSRKYDSSAQD